MMASQIGKPRGILYPAAGEARFRLSLHPPAPDLTCFVEHYWTVTWDLRGREPYQSETLPHPCVHIVVEECSAADRQNAARIFGVMRGKFSRLLEGEGRAFGIKFRPGAFYSFVRSPVSAFTDRAIALDAAFGAAGAALETAILALAGEMERIDRAETFLRACYPERDETLCLIAESVDHIVADRTITTVDDLTARLNLNKRTLQRTFSRYVGVGPKWVIRRYRLHEAADRAANGTSVDWPALALELGYFDQAHFVKDFKAMVGRTPADYAKAIDVGPP